MAGIALSRLLRPFVWLLSLAILSLVLPVLLAAITPIMLLVWLVGLIGAIASPGFRKDINFLPVSYLSWLLLWPALLVSMIVPALALALAALLHFQGSAELAQVPAMLHRLLPTDWQRALPQPSLQGLAAFCVVAGTIGFSSHCVYVLLDVPWRLKQIRQVRALPRSKARSAAIGLSEFEGTARAERDVEDNLISRAREGPASAFYLEDDTGRIRVEPQEAVVRPRSTSGMSLQLNEIEGGIRDGDHVYVIGFVQPRAPDSDELVVRPLRQRLVSSPVARLLFAAKQQMADRDTPNVFIVEKGREHNLILRLRMTLWDFCIASAVYLVASLWLVQAAWPFM